MGTPKTGDMFVTDCSNRVGSNAGYDLTMPSPWTYRQAGGHIIGRSCPAEARACRDILGGGDLGVLGGDGR